MATQTSELFMAAHVSSTEARQGGYSKSQAHNTYYTQFIEA